MNNGFKYFPEKLFNKAVRMTNIGVQKFFGMSRPSEIFYSIKDGNWNDITIWETVSGRVGKLPTANDDVYIKTVVVVSVTSNSFNMFVTGRLDFSAGIPLTINGNFQCPGSLSFTVAGTLILMGDKNYINPLLFTPNTGNIRFSGSINQEILSLPYYNLAIEGNAKKYLTSHLVISNNLVAGLGFGSHTIVALEHFDLTVTGTTYFNNMQLTKISSGNILFIGTATMGRYINRLNLSDYAIDFSLGNPTVEFRNGVNFPAANGSMLINTGTNTWNFTTNNQFINAGTSGSVIISPFECPIVIAAGIELTIQSLGSALTINLNNTINGADGASKLINRGVLNFTSQIAAEGSMSVGLYDFTGGANTIGYTGNYTATLLGGSEYWNLVISGTGIKTQAAGTRTITGSLTINIGARLDSAGNTTVGGNANLAGSGATLNLLTYDWIFGSFIPAGGNGVFTKTGAGSIIIIGQFGGDVGNWFVTFSGNPTVELRGGIYFGMQVANFISGSGQWTFTTNNQTLVFSTTGAYVITTAPIISGAITVTKLSSFSGILQIPYIDGTVAGSTYINQGRTYLTSSTLPMSTAGVFTYNGGTSSTIGYIFNGAFTLPYTAYNNLVINGTGMKQVIGNTTIDANFTLVGYNAATDGLELLGFNLTVTGTSDVDGLLSKTGAGTLLFIGSYISQDITGAMNFTGNPNVEFRNGYQGPIQTGLYTGTGTFTFSTNNQGIIGQSPETIWDCNILISGAITVTQTFQTNIFKGSINGNNALSKFDNRSIVKYRNATQPMVTGILETNAAANTWFYDLAGNQDVKGDTNIAVKQVYRTLTLAGSGVKKLTGYVSVINVFTLTAPATKDDNGFTLTNP